MTVSAHRALALAIVLAASGCTVLFDPDRLDYVDDAGATDAGEVDAGSVDAGAIDAGHDAGPTAPEDASVGTDAGPPSCGHVGEECCAPPLPACAEGANCTLDGCQPCGGPGQACCTSGAPCEVLSCLTATNRCPPVTPLVLVAHPDGGTYGIDAYEVSREQYQAWLQTNPVAEGALVGPGCSSNTEFQPDTACIAGGYSCTGAGCSQHPQTCIDWCDAFAYCAAVGKALCGRYDGGTLSPSSFAQVSLSPWYNACSSGGRYDYSPGDGSLGLDAACQFTNYGEPTDVASLTECQSPDDGYRGVLALTGNAREWINACNTSSGTCLAVGGSYADNDDYEGLCAYTLSFDRASRFPAIGFRCCALP